MCFTFHILGVTAIFTPKEGLFWGVPTENFQLSLIEDPNMSHTNGKEISCRIQISNLQVKKRQPGKIYYALTLSPKGGGATGISRESAKLAWPGLLWLLF